MHCIKNIFSILFLWIPVLLSAQKIEKLQSGKNTSIRGLSVVNNEVVWVSGSNGTVARSTDSGITWEWMQVKGFEKSDFRDIEAFDASTAIIMAVAEPAYMLKTHNAGKSWQVVFEDKRQGMFLDAMEFWNTQSGIVIGDPVDGKIFIARTFDGGDSWQLLPNPNYPIAEKGEAMFASSGTNIRALSLAEAVFVTGGTHSRFFLRDKKISLPLVQGKESTGANSLAIYRSSSRKPEKNMVAVGGDFTADTISIQNCAITKDGGYTWENPTIAPHGYRSCVEYITRNRLITCGTSGIDVSEDGGKNWKLISNDSFHVCRKAKKGTAVFLAGRNGNIARVVW